MLSIDARPKPFDLPVGRTALIMIDMQRDFVEKGGYGYLQCNSEEIFSKVSNIIEPCKNLLDTARLLGMCVIHTREGHEPDLRDLCSAKKFRQASAQPENYPLLIGDKGPMGRLLVRGEYGHDIIDALKPLKSEIVIDKPGKGTFYNTDIHQVLVTRGITHLLLAGVTTECCVATTFREANDHGFDCCVLLDCTSGFNMPIYEQTIKTFCAYDGLLGSVSTGKALMELKGEKGALQKGFSESSSNIFRILSQHSDVLPLHGVLFMAGSGIGSASTIVKILEAKGAVFRGNGDVISAFEKDISFYVSVDDEKSYRDLVSFVPSRGMVSLGGASHGAFSFVRILARTAAEARYVFATGRAFDPQDEMSKQHYEYAVKPVDYRGAEGGFFYASESVELTGTSVDFDWTTITAVQKFELDGDFAAVMQKLLVIQKNFSSEFQPFGSPDVVVCENPWPLCKFLGVPLAEINGVFLVGEVGLDGRLLDIAEVIE